MAIKEIKDIKRIIQEELPKVMQTDEEIARFILRLSSQYYAGKIETENRFDRMFKELQKDREVQSRKWDEQNRKWEEQNKRLEEHARSLEGQNRKWDEQNRKWEEQNKRLEEHARSLDDHNRKWDEQNRKWDEQNKRLEEHARSLEGQNRKWDEQNRKWEEQNKRLEEHARSLEGQNRKWDEQNRKWNEQNRKWNEQNRKWDENQKIIQGLFEELKVMNRKHDQSIGALGARWGLHAEESFRNALAGILEDSFKVKVLHIKEFDDKGEVFGRPDQVELDVLIKDGLLIICEIKSSMSRADTYTFDRKVRFYENLHGTKADRKIVISPMVDERTRSLACDLGIDVYSYAEDVRDDS